MSADPDVPRASEALLRPVRPGNPFEDTVERLLQTIRLGVLAMTRELGVQFAREGIRVNALSPGPVATPLLTELFASDPERAERRLVQVPLGRFAEPAEIAAAVAFLASDDASFITASNFLVDGGITGAYVTPL